LINRRRICTYTNDGAADLSSPRWPLVALLAVSFVLYAVRLDYSPAHLHGAEVMFALQAHAIAHTAHDVYGRFMPLYFQMQPLGENTWWHPVIVYWMAIWFQFLDPVQWAVRLPTVVIGILDIALIFFVARRISGDARWALVTAALLALTPAHYMQSRIAMDYLYPVPFMLAWLLCLLIYLDRKQPWLLFVPARCWGSAFIAIWRPCS
jgi:4-amino-4-deoxy-L-arabinose transferase-like glycosyltransferase